MIAAGGLIVIETVTSPMSMASKRLWRSSSVSIATPSLPTSPNERSSSESCPINEGMSNAVAQYRSAVIEQVPEALLVSAAVPNPANWRIVHNLPRYMLAYTPRGNGNSPGKPIGRLRIRRQIGLRIQRADRLPRERRERLVAGLGLRMARTPALEVLSKVRGGHRRIVYPTCGQSLLVAIGGSASERYALDRSARSRCQTEVSSV